MSKLSKLKPIVRLSVVNPDTESNSVFGRGIANLCLGVREAGSLLKRRSQEHGHGI